MSDPVIDIERMCYGGAGIGRIEGKACFTQFTAPGDRARVRVTREKKNFAEAELVEILEPSGVRTEPPCPYFGSCGGCNWQHLAYAEQLKQKHEIFAGTVARIGGLEGVEILPTLASPIEYQYRSRIQLKLVVQQAGVQFGFFRGGTHEVIDIPAGCRIADSVLNRILNEFRPVLPRFAAKERIPQIDLALGDDGSSIAILHLQGSCTPELLERISALRTELPSVSGLFLRESGRGNLVRVFGVERLSYRIPEGLFPGGRALALSFGRGGFSQVNLRQNLNLIRTVAEWCECSGRERVLDLYCGNGNLSLPIASMVQEVIGVEGFAPSVADARTNASENGIANATYLAEDAAKALRRMKAAGERFDVAILDPPRTGAQEVSLLAELGPRRIIYVSCDPPTLARDLAALVAKGYRALKALPVDMFPQTYHLESVTLLAKS
ncbi:23S rRNA (uracil(1939)-C(5))-methyltransferase RlmD [Geomesophilobacter sediminis]|uniref:23S rRNA (Uracil(1939)-C(5))-methyltransferase RlmD n=1 Tax=Geomesophilobacter sediminis TaxID=2798584 RepID=A0A8J7LXX4_9BACT|nr:23S rRNA (uracil(1939)-C(5))-methyltransferase RlmD [Geomesophilobacter sediminis]MBJ6723871.1 23S rRNA (uracil(1939)-C(5))-methyltransferase RlmD [Geomesophilobacter sediminis]